MDNERHMVMATASAARPLELLENIFGTCAAANTAAPHSCHASRRVAPVGCLACCTAALKGRLVCSKLQGPVAGSIQVQSHRSLSAPPPKRAATSAIAPQLPHKMEASPISTSADLACCRDEIEELISTSVRRADQAEAPAAGSPEAKRDDLAALLLALAAVYEAAPQLWLDPELR